MAKPYKPLVRCIDCRRAVLMRWWKNPVIAECDGNREVAEAGRICSRFERRKTPPKIQQKNTYEKIN